MRSLRLAGSAWALAAWLAGSAAAQQDTPPGGTPPATPPSAPPAGTPPASTPPASTPRPAAPAEEEERPAGAPSDEAADRVVIPTEELQPDAAVTFPVDI
jgi:hypothetical protein